MLWLASTHIHTRAYKYNWYLIEGCGFYARQKLVLTATHIQRPLWERQHSRFSTKDSGQCSNRSGCVRIWYVWLLLPFNHHKVNIYISCYSMISLWALLFHLIKSYVNKTELDISNMTLQLTQSKSNKGV